MAIDQELAQNIFLELNSTKQNLQNLQVDGQALLQKLSSIIIIQAQELSLFHLFEAHVDAGKVSEELWTEIKVMLAGIRTATKST